MWCIRGGTARGRPLGARPRAPSGRGLRHLWVARARSSCSTWVMQVGLFVQVLQGSPVSTLAVVELVGTVPALVALPVAGTLADRIDPRRLAKGSMVAQTLCVAAMALLLGTDVWLVAAMYAGQGVANSLWPPARQ